MTHLVCDVDMYRVMLKYSCYVPRITPQNVPLPTPKIHHFAIFQPAMLKTWQECLYTSLYLLPSFFTPTHPGSCERDSLSPFVTLFESVKKKSEGEDGEGLHGRCSKFTISPLGSLALPDQTPPHWSFPTLVKVREHAAICHTANVWVSFSDLCCCNRFILSHF